jgi:hypothetical protein
MPDRIAFDVDLYPLVDLAVRLDVLDEHYARLEAVYNEARRAPAFDCRLSDQGWLRASTSPYFFMATCSPDAAEQAALVVEAYLDAWLGIWDHAQEIEGEEAARVAERLHWITKGLREREPKRAMLETLLGREVTEKLKAAMV